MSEGTRPVAFFPSSYAIVTGGTFGGVVNNHHHTHIQSVGKGGYERLLDVVATNALHNSGHIFDPPKCHPGTRVAVMDTIMEWKSGVSKHADAHEKYVAWLSGGAGAGKSAIGRSICERCDEDGTLLASFFFGSTDLTRNHAKSLAATIAYQICALHPAIRKAVSDFIDYDPLVFSRSLRTQLVSLVVDPLSTVYANNPQNAPRLIVIDGLDECLDKSSQRDVIETITHIVSICSIPIRVLICSRPDSNITNMFSSAKINPSVFRIFLSDEYSPWKDIKLYLDDLFRDIREGHIFKSLLPAFWPTDDHVYQLVEKSSGQFIYASTVVRYVESPQHRPNQRLDAILGLRAPFKDLPFAELDAVYTHVLNMAQDPRLAAVILEFPPIYGTLACSDIERILGLESGDVQVAMSDMAALVNISVPESGVPQVALLHKSFADFLFDSSRSKKFHVSFHETLARNILRMMNIFSENHVECRFVEKSYISPVRAVLSHRSIDYHMWTPLDQAAVLNAVAQFPTEALTKHIFTHVKRFCAETTFFQSFFRFMINKTLPQKLRDICQLHITLFCKTFLRAFLEKYHHDHKMSFVFAFTQLIPPVYSLLLISDPNCIARLLFAFEYRDLKSLRIKYIFRRHMEDAEKTHMLSLAATFCLETLCERFHGLKSRQKPTQDSWIDRMKRKITPWQWHRRHPYRHLRPTIFSITYRRMFPMYTRVKGWNMSFTNHLPYVDGPTAASIGEAVKYVAFMKYFMKMLPLAGRYDPLIELCKTQSFSPLSILAPILSRRARRSIAEYLERMEAMED